MHHSKFSQPHVKRKLILSGAIAVASAVITLIRLLDSLQKNPTLTQAKTLRDTMAKENITFSDICTEEASLLRIEKTAHLNTAARWLKHARTHNTPNLEAVGYVLDHLEKAGEQATAIGATDAELESLPEAMRKRRRSSLAKIRRKSSSGRSERLKEIDQVDDREGVAVEQPAGFHQPDVFAPGENSGLNSWETANEGVESRELVNA